MYLAICVGIVLETFIGVALIVDVSSLRLPHSSLSIVFPSKHALEPKSRLIGKFGSFEREVGLGESFPFSMVAVFSGGSGRLVGLSLASEVFVEHHRFLARRPANENFLPITLQLLFAQWATKSKRLTDENLLFNFKLKSEIFTESKKHDRMTMKNSEKIEREQLNQSN